MIRPPPRSTLFPYTTLFRSGNIAVKQKTISGVSGAILYTYNLDGSVSPLTSPNGHTYSYGYGNAERPLSLSDNAIGATYVQNAHYNAPGQLTSAQHGLGLAITETNTFNNQLQPLSLSVSSTSQTVLSLSYTWPTPGLGNNGTLYRWVVNQRNSGSNRSTQYVYDQLNRLVTAGTVPGAGTPWSTVYSYDAWGNLTQKSTSGPGEPNVTLTANTANQVNGVGGGYTYDAAGNLTFDGVNQLRFDAENRLTPSGSTVVYSYDGDGRRVKTVNGDGTTNFWYDDSGTVVATTGAWTRDYVYFNGRRVAYFAPSSGNQHYYWSDHLKSARVMSNSDGSAIEWEADYLPYGTKQVMNNFLDNFFLFTEDQFDYELGYYYAVAREQSPVLGRFLSADQDNASIDLRNPQSFNRYSYVLNNPLNSVDPTGLDCVYFNNQGNDVESIDHNSNSKECGENGGDWVNGTTYKDLTAYNSATDKWQIVSYDTNAEQIYWSEALAPGTESGGTSCSGNCDTANGYSEIGYQFFNSQLQPGIYWYGALNWAVNETNRVPKYQQWAIGDPNGRHWCGAGGTGVPTGNDDWSCMAHDTNYYFTGNTFPGINYNPFANPIRGRQLQQINQSLCNNVTSSRIRGFFTATYWGCR